MNRAEAPMGAEEIKKDRVIEESIAAAAEAAKATNPKAVMKAVKRAVELEDDAALIEEAERLKAEKLMQDQSDKFSDEMMKRAS